MNNRTTPKKSLHFSTVELAGVPYAILPLTTLTALCRKAGVTPTPLPAPAPSTLDTTPEELNPANVARRLADRRKRAGLTQGQLAAKAGVRIETVNRIERGHVTPDFRTLRKLLQAMLQAETTPNNRKDHP